MSKTLTVILANDLTAIVHTLGSALHVAAASLEQSHSDDHATQVAHYAAADAVRTVADAIGYVLIGTESFIDPEAEPND